MMSAGGGGGGVYSITTLIIKWHVGLLLETDDSFLGLF